MRKKILVAPLNWGLGHATRCIPIINALIKYNYLPIIASDGAALKLLKHEFPNLQTIELPSYNITYSTSTKGFRWALLKNMPQIRAAVEKEHQITKSIVDNENILGIISDNRFGVYNQNIPSVYMTHQLQVLSGWSTWFSTKIHQSIIKKFDACWIPDYEQTPYLSGIMGHDKSFKNSITYLGPLSRFENSPLNMTFDVLIILSGPEPQRQLLEDKLRIVFQEYSGQVIMVRGVVEDFLTQETVNHMTIYNYLTSDALNELILKSRYILARSGYTSIMDLMHLKAKAFFIPTPGQWEQEYLAHELQRQKLAPYCNQDDFDLKEFSRILEFQAMQVSKSAIDFDHLFRLFQGE